MIDLYLIKQHCRLEQDFSDDDALLDAYAAAAKDFVEAHTSRNLYGLPSDVPPEDEDSLILNGAIRAAMLLLIGHWYENRESVVIGVTTSAVPMSVDSLIQPYRIYGV